MAAVDSSVGIAAAVEVVVAAAAVAVAAANDAEQWLLADCRTNF